MSSLKYLPLPTVKKWEPEARRRNVSKVARSGRGFLTAYKKAGTASKLPDAWKRKRDAFVARHMAQVKAKGEPLFEQDGRPTRRHLALIMWAYSPVQAKVKASAMQKTNPAEPPVLAMVKVRKIKPSLKTPQAKQVVSMHFEDVGWRPDRYGNLLHPTKNDERIHFSKLRVQKQAKIQGTWRNIRTWSPVDLARQIVVEAASKAGDEKLLAEWQKGQAAKAKAKKRAVSRKEKQKLEQLAEKLAMKQLGFEHPRLLAMIGCHVLVDKEQLELLVKRRDELIQNYMVHLEAGHAVPADHAFASVDKPPTPPLGYDATYLWRETLDGVIYTVHVEHASRGEATITIGSCADIALRVDPRTHQLRVPTYTPKGDACISGRVFFNGDTFMASLFLIAAKAKRSGAGSRVLSLWCRMMAGYGIEAWRAEAVGEEGALFLKALAQRGKVEILGGKGSDLVITCLEDEPRKSNPSRGKSSRQNSTDAAIEAYVETLPPGQWMHIRVDKKAKGHPEVVEVGPLSGLKEVMQVRKAGGIAVHKPKSFAPKYRYPKANPMRKRAGKPRIPKTWSQT